MAEIRRKRRPDLQPLDERFLDDAELLTDDEPILDETGEEVIPDFSLDEGVPPEEIFDTEGRGLPTKYPEDDYGFTGETPVSRAKHEPRAGTVSDKFRRASSGSALAGADKTTGYTPSEGETFTLDETGQMVVPEGRKVEDFAPGVRKALDKLDRRGPSPKGGARPSSPTPRTPGSSTPPRPAISSKFAPATPPAQPSREPSVLKPDQREAGIGEQTGLDQTLKSVDPRFRRGMGEDTGGPLDDLLGQPVEPPADELGGAAGLRTGDIPDKPQGGGGSGGKTADSEWWGGAPGKGYQNLAGDEVIPQEQTRTTTETRSRTDVDPRYKGQFDNALEVMREARREGARDIQGALGRAGEEGKADQARFAEGKQGALDQYMQGMDRVDRKKFIDTIAGNLGKVISGGIGLGAIPTPGVSASGPLNVAKYYEYQPLDVSGERAAEKSKFDANMQLQKELENAKAKGREDELRGYEMLAKFRGDMSDKELGRLLDVMNMTKQAINQGFNIQSASIFEPKLFMELMKMDEQERMKTIEMYNDILRSMIGAQAAGGARGLGNERPEFTEVMPPDQKRMDKIMGHVDNLVASAFPGKNRKPADMLADIDAYLNKNAETNYLTGKFDIDPVSIRIIRELKNHLQSLPQNSVIADPSRYIRGWVSDPNVMLQLGITSGRSTQYQGGKPVLEKPISRVPPGVQVPGAPSEAPAQPPQRGPAPAPQKATLFRSKGQIINRKTGRPVTRQELDAIVAEDAKRGFRYPPEILQSVQ